ncbi:hypothetical protein QB734_002924 [Listeria monocytogenes]|nr:hypothetical protein [Listeria monocytogenes]EKS4552575.1 hypothetical protein [Listeria monocytogenes]
MYADTSTHSGVYSLYQRGCPQAGTTSDSEARHSAFTNEYPPVLLHGLEATWL